VQLKTFLLKLKEKRKNDLVSNAINFGMLENDYVFTLVAATFLHVMTLLFCVVYFINKQIYLSFLNCMFILYVGEMAIAILWDKRIKLIDIIYLFLLAVFYFFTTFFTNGGLGSVPSLIFPLVLMCGLEYCRVDKYFDFILKAISLFVIISFSLIIIVLFEDYSSFYEKYYYLNMNVIACLALTGFMTWSSLADYEDWKDKILFVLLLSLTFCIIDTMKGRTSLLGLVAYCIFFFTPKIVFNKIFAVKWTVILIILGLFVPLLYIEFYKMNIDLVIFGKNLYTGRESVWANLFNQLEQRGIAGLMFGIGSHADIYDGTFDAHNSYYSIIGCFGIIGFIIYLVFFISKIKAAFNYLEDRKIRKLLSCFFAFLVVSWFESVNIISLFCFSFFIPIGLTLSRTRELKRRARFMSDLTKI